MYGAYEKLHKTYVKHLNCKLYYEELRNTCVTWHGIDPKLPEDDTIVSKRVGLR